MTRREPDMDITECRECGAEFNLAAQYYYDNLCPSCKQDQDGKKTSWPACPICESRFEPNTGIDVTIPKRNSFGGKERIRVCSAECEAAAKGRRP